MINRVIRHPYAQSVITLSCCEKFNLSHCESPPIDRKVLEVGDRWANDDDNDDDDDDDDRDDEIFAGGKSIIYHSFKIARASSITCHSHHYCFMKYLFRKMKR